MRMSVKTALLAGAFAAGLAALPAAAQDYGYGAPGASPQDVIVQAPRMRHYTPQRSTIGAPIVDVGLSAPVRYDDLDLTTDWGVRKLHTRIFVAARRLCQRLDNRYPITVSDGAPSCYRQAVDDAMMQADAAVDRAYGG
ncbi:MAG: UrcA family protein [Proteobacteria bacterium]|nr:UrcA family protein [Pseudomonadota bacterium]